MKLSSLRNSLAIGAIVSFAITQSAHALDFNFSFNDGFGTVSGRIIGLEDDVVDQAADNVFIDDFPAGLGGSFDIGNDATTWTTIFANNFTVAGGNIVAAEFSASTASFDDQFCLNSSCSGATNFFSLDDDSTSVANSGGFAAITFTPVPFEFETSLSLIALSSMFSSYVWSKKKNASKLTIKN